VTSQHISEQFNKVTGNSFEIREKYLIEEASSKPEYKLDNDDKVIKKLMSILQFLNFFL
jgi:hypothetical protein